MKLKHITLFLCSTMLLSSCFVTDLDPKDALTDATYWNSVNDLELYTNGLYSSLPIPAVGADETSDNMLKSTYSKLIFDEITVPVDANSSSWSWGTIRQHNYFLNRYKSVQGPDEVINKYLAEVLVFKASTYFDKMVRFGDVPWFEKDLATTDKELLYKPRDPRELVLKNIIRDLEIAIEWLPEKENAAPNRLHKDAARTLLARICLHEGTFRKYNDYSDSYTPESLLKKAAEVAKKIIDTNRYDIVKGTDQGAGQKSLDGYPLYYSNLFTQEDLSSNKEAILHRTYIKGIKPHFLAYFAINGSKGFNKDFIESFLCKDGKPIGVSPLYKGDITPEQEMENRDPRLYQVVDNPNKPYFVDNDVVHTNKQPNIESLQGVTGYYPVKFTPASLEQQEFNLSTYDLFAFRYAEVLLIYAEATAELGECTQGVLDQTINKLRDRVDMAHLTVTPIADPNPIDYGYKISPLLYEIRRERRIELIMESRRWFDLLRWNSFKLLENPKTMLGMRITPEVEELYEEGTFGGHYGKAVIDYQGKTYLRIYPDKELNDPARVWKPNDRRYLDPIPTQELAINPQLKQNPGWSE